MQAPVFAVVGQRLVARIDDGAVKLHPLVNVVHDVIRALTDLERDRALRGRRLEIERERIRLPDAARAREDLARGEKREQRPEDGRTELRLPFHEIILMATEGRAGVMVDIVLDEGNPLRHPERVQTRLEKLIAGEVVGDEVAEMNALRRGILEVSHIEVNAATVEQETAVAGRFFVIAIMQVDRARARLAKEMVLDARRPAFRPAATGAARDETTVLRLNPYDPIHPSLLSAPGGICQA